MCLGSRKVENLSMGMSLHHQSKGAGRAVLRTDRWSAGLLCFANDATYRPGKQNMTAGCLSRLPLLTPGDDSEVPDMVAAVFQESVHAVSSQNSLQPVRHDLNWHNLDTDSVQKQRLRELYWWPIMDIYVHNMIASCVLCQYTDRNAKTAPSPLVPVDLPNGPWQKVGSDISGPFEHAKWDCRYSITLTDCYSKWPEVAFACTVTADEVVQFLATVFSREGNSYTLVSDNGCQFTSHAIATFLRERD